MTPRSLFNKLNTRPEALVTLTLLKTLSRSALKPKQWLEYHEHLLFYKAYPPSAEIHSFCQKELTGFAQKKAVKDEAFEQSGVAGSNFRYAYDFPMAKWMQGKLGKNIDIEWDTYEERDDDPLQDLMALLMEANEGDVIDSADITASQLIQKSVGSQYVNSLHWLLDRFEKTFAEPLRSHLYNQMQIMLSMTLVKSAPTRTLLEDRKPEQLFIWKPAEAKAKFDLVAEIKKKITLPKPVSDKRGKELLDLVFGTLLVRQRELYPSIHANPSEFYEIPLERGVKIVLWFMKTDRRLPLEAGWGLICLKNGVPIGYGAGGLLQSQSEIAINVFDTFRGGEAAWLYAQYARVMYAMSGAKWLVTRKYQIGYENEEGLQSGSYWFYDKLGFRSLDGSIRKLADSERTKIAKNKNHRSSRKTLQKLCEADVVLHLDGRPASEYHEFPLAKTGLLATKSIKENFGGNRDNLTQKVISILEKNYGFSKASLKKINNDRFAQMGLLMLALPDFPSWKKSTRQSAFKLCLAKASAFEADYVRAFRDADAFFQALRRQAK